MAHKIHITVLSLIFLFFIWPVSEGFPVVVTVDASTNIGDLPGVFRSGLMGAWNSDFEPLTYEITNKDKKPYMRLALGIGWDEDLTKPLDFDIRLKKWLRDIVDPNIIKYQNAGYQTVITLTEVPRWLSPYPGTDECLPNADGCWRKWQFSPPNDYAEWKKLLQLIVTTQKQDGINADYIIWDEPDWMFYGTEEQYLELYKNSVEAIKGIDSNIKVGAPGVGCWSCKKNRNCPADLTGLPDGECPVLDHSMIEGLIGYVSSNNISMDFIDWHFPDLASFTQHVNSTRNWLTTSGLDSSMPLTIGEWVFSPKNQDESTEGGAANAIYMLKAFTDNGIYRHSATSIYDQSGWTSGDWANVGFFSSDGVIRAKWNAFKAVDRLPSQRLSVSSDNGNLVPTVAARDNTKIAVVMASPTTSQQVTLGVNNLASGTYTVRKYIIDGNMNEIHSNPCRYNKKTEFAPSTTQCGIDGAIDQAVANARKEAENATNAYLVSAGISQQNANSIFVCFNNAACDIETFITAYCQQNPNRCAGKKPVIAEAQKLYNNLFYHGKYRTNSGKIYAISTFIDQINNLKEVSLEGSIQERQVEVTGGTFTENITLEPFSVLLIELLH